MISSSMSTDLFLRERSLTLNTVPSYSSATSCPRTLAEAILPIASLFIISDPEVLYLFGGVPFHSSQLIILSFFLPDPFNIEKTTIARITSNRARAINSVMDR